MKKIIITTPTLAAGGMEQSVVNFAKMFTQAGFIVKIYLISSEEIKIDVPEEIEVIIGKKNVSDKHLIPFSLLKLRKYTMNFKPDFIISFSGRLSPFVIISLLGVTKNVIPFHRSNPNTTYGKLIGSLSKILYPSCKALLVQTQKAKKIFYQKYRNNNIIVIPNIVREINLPYCEKEKIILNVSRLDKGKGLENLIKMFSIIQDSEWKLYIVGDGVLRHKLEKLINDLKLNEKVKLLGYKKNVDFYLSKASIFAFSSETEGYPNALLEAMCAGLACISFDCSTGPSEMIEDGINGYLVPLGDQQEYIIKLSNLMKDKNLRSAFGERAKSLNISNSPESVSKKMIFELSNIEW